MPLRSPVAFPLFPIVQGPNGPQCGCDREGCSRVGKHPAVKWKELKEGDPVSRPSPGAGAGIKTGARPFGSGVFVVDLDGEEAQLLFHSMGPCPETFTVATGRSGGVHYYFRHPGFYLGNTKSDLGPKIDTRGDGGFVIAPGSPHETGSTYRVVRDVEPADAPRWLLDWLRERSAPPATHSYEGDVEGRERERRRELYENYLKITPPCVSGHGGDERLFDVVQYGAYDLALPTEDVLELVAEHFDPRCEPPWGAELEERVLHKAHYAKTASTRPRKLPLLEEEENLLADLTTPVPESVPGNDEGNDADCGFRIRWGGWAETPVPPTFLVDGLLLENKVTMIFAEPGSIKTWTAIDIASAVSAGIPWLGERAVKKGPVLYIDFEDGEHEFHRRVHKLSGGVDRPDLGYMYSPGRMDSEELWLKLDKLQQSRGLALIVIDTLAGGTPGVDENDRNAADALQLAGRLTEASSRRGKGVTVLVLHHANRSGEIRGTSAYKANVDVLFKLETVKDDGDGTHQAKLTCTKSGQKKVLPIQLEFTDDGLKRIEVESKAEKDSKKGDKRTLDQLQQEILLLIASEGPFSSIEKIRARVQAKAANVNAVMSELEAAGDIVKLEDGWVRDSETFRKERLRAVVRENGEWSRGKLIAHAFVSKEFFEKCERLGRVAPRASGGDIVGFIWIDLP